MKSVYGFFCVYIKFYSSVVFYVIKAEDGRLYREGRPTHHPYISSIEQSAINEDILTSL